MQLKVFGILNQSLKFTTLIERVPETHGCLLSLPLSLIFNFYILCYGMFFFYMLSNDLYVFICSFFCLGISA